MEKRTFTTVALFSVLISLVTSMMHFVIEFHKTFWKNSESLLSISYRIRAKTFQPSTWTRPVLSHINALQSQSYKVINWSFLLIMFPITKYCQFIMWSMRYCKKLAFKGYLWSRTPFYIILTDTSVFPIAKMSSLLTEVRSSRRSYRYERGYASSNSHHGRCVRRETMEHPLLWCGRSTEIVGESADA